MDTQTRLEIAPKTPRKRRDAAQRLQEEEEKLAKLRSQAALQEARSTEEGLRLSEALDALRAEQRSAKLILSDGPQGHAARIAKKQDWIQRYEQEMAEAEETLAQSDAQIQEIQNRIQNLANSLNSEGATE